MDIKVQTPPSFSNISDVYRYLFQMAQTLNAANEAIQAQTDKQITTALKSSGIETGGENAVAQNLRSLILNTAETINAVIEQNVRTLNTRIDANSQRFGNITSTVSQTITESAESTIQQFSRSDLITSISGNIESLKSYREVTEGYIKSGFIDVDDDGVPVLGIAIGQQLRSTTVTDIYGVKREKIDKDIPCAFYTAEKVSFRMNGKEIAYFSRNSLHCGNIEIEGSVKISGKWSITGNNSMTIRWIGSN